MPSDPTMDIEALTAPIAGSAPTGVDLRQDTGSLYYELRQLLRECGEAERQADLGDERRDLALWERLAQGCEAVLREQTKDLEIACWLVVARAHARCGDASEFVGLRDAFHLVRELCTRYWDTLHSVQDEDDPDAKVAPIDALGGERGLFGAPLVRAIRKIPLTPRVPPGPFAYWQIAARERIDDTAAVYQAVRQADRDFFPALMLEIDALSRAVADLAFALGDLPCGVPYGVGGIRDAIDGCRTMVDRITSGRHAYGPPPPAPPRPPPPARYDAALGFRVPANATLDFAPLLAPISRDAPTGADLRADTSSLYYELRDLRRECAADERSIEPEFWQHDIGDKWRRLADGCETALRDHTKDLEIACWLVVARARVRVGDASQFAGLRDAFRLVDALCARYWDTLHSVQDDGDPEARIGPIQALEGDAYNGRDSALLVAIRNIPLTPAPPPGPFAYWQLVEMEKKYWKRIAVDQEFEKWAERHNQQGPAHMYLVLKANAKADYNDFAAPMIRDIDAASAGVAVLNETLVDRLGPAAPSTWKIRRALHQCRVMMGRMHSVRPPYVQEMFTFAGASRPLPVLGEEE